jgi:hypothetical protein
LLTKGKREVFPIKQSAANFAIGSIPELRNERDGLAHKRALGPEDGMSDYMMAQPKEPVAMTKLERELSSTLHLLLSLHCCSQGVSVANSRAGITGQAIELLESIGYEVRG